jgi:hypothetical protein
MFVRKLILRRYITGTQVGVRSICSRSGVDSTLCQGIQVLRLSALVHTFTAFSSSLLPKTQEYDYMFCSLSSPKQLNMMRRHEERPGHIPDICSLQLPRPHLIMIMELS